MVLKEVPVTDATSSGITMDELLSTFFFPGTHYKYNGRVRCRDYWKREIVKGGFSPHQVSAEGGGGCL